MTTVTATHGLARRVAIVAAAVCLLTLSAKVTVPFWPVPMTMQVAAVLLIAAVGGMRLGATSMASYLALGAVGLPVFAGTPAKGIGLAYMTGPTGGYLLGFLIAAALVGWMAERARGPLLWATMLGALALIYACGVAWVARFVPADGLIAAGIAPFFAGDLLKVGVAALLAHLAPPAVVRLVRGQGDV